MDDLDELRRCYYCRKIWMKREVAGEGCCPTCASRKFTDVRRMTDVEMSEVMARGYKPSEEWEHHDSPLG